MEELEVSGTDMVEAPVLALPVTRRKQIIVLVTAFLAVFITIGLNQTYAIFQAAYTSPTNDLLSHHGEINKALVAFVGTLGSGLTWAGSVFVNPLMARTKDLRRITMTGAILMSLGLGLASVCTEVWQLLLTQGFLYGIGSSMLYFPPVAVAPEYFDANRGAAMGLVLSAAGTGGLTFAPITRLLLSRIGIRWTLRFLAFLTVVIAIPVVLLTQPSRSASRQRTLVNISIAKKPTFLFQVLAAFFQAAGNAVPLTFFTSFTTELGYSIGLGAILLGASNAINSVSRLAMGFIADKVGRQNILMVSCLGCALSVLALWLPAAIAGSKAVFLVYMVFYAVVSGGYNAVQPTTISDLFGIQAYASVNGFVYLIRGLGQIFGSPVGGTILTASGSDSATVDIPSSGDNYRNLIWYDGALLTACFICVVLVRAFDAVDRGHWKWKA